MNRETIFIKSGSTNDIPMSYLSQGAAKLMVCLPGVGYTSDGPLFHYLRIIGANQGYDILSVKYGFQIAGKSSSGQQPDLPYVDSKMAIDQVWDGRYESLCIVGKSFGTPLAARLIHEIDVAGKCLILLTPIGNAAAAARGVNTLAIIGTKDYYYDADLIKNTPTIDWHVLEGLNHSLEVKGDWQVSLQKMSEIMGVCDSFLGGAAAT
jgi:hypothetical protein